MKRLIPTLAASLLIGGAAFAQDTSETPAPAPPPPPPTCEGENYRAFDFWLGEWEVTDGNGTVYGTNSITSHENGCLLLENWTSATGGTGQSYNFVDPVSGLWRQVWVSQAANIDYDGGPTEAGGIRLQGTIHYRNGTSNPFWGEWTPQEDGTVKQYFEQMDPATNKWSPWFLGIYTRIEATDSNG
ncbi:MAG: hypothetical protein AAFX02_11160 [Pseudomonadota bacterium]